jgi:hypothetical protein
MWLLLIWIIYLILEQSTQKSMGLGITFWGDILEWILGVLPAYHLQSHRLRPKTYAPFNKLNTGTAIKKFLLLKQ